MVFTGSISNFVQEDSGAVTVDWVVLTAGIVGLGLAVTTVVSSGVENLSGDTATELTEIEIMTSFTTALADYSGYSLVGPSHSESWRTSEQARFGAMSDADLMLAYNNSYATAVGGVYPHQNHETDRIGVMETEMAARGISVPSGNTGYSTLHSNLGGTPA